MLKDEEKKKYQREYMRKKRSNKDNDVRPTDVRPVLLHRPNGPDYNPDEMLDGRKRYLGPFTDGQVHDRLSVPVPVLNHRRWQEITMSNRANEYRSEPTSPEIVKRLKERMKS